MKQDFERLDELLIKDEDDFTTAETEEFERLAPLLVDPAYQEHRLALIAAATERLS